MDIESLYQDLLDSPVDESVAKEAKAQTSFQTVPTGRYTFTQNKATWEQASEQAPWPGRFMLKVRAKAKGENGAGSVSFDASPEVMRTKTGRLDGPSTLWGNLITSFGLEGASNRKVGEYVAQYDLDAYVEEAYQTPDGWRTPKNLAERAGFEKEGYTKRNFVRNLKGVQA